jgi:undecaprenyl-diphosphatase
MEALQSFFSQIPEWLNQNPEWFLLTVFLTAFSESLAIIGLIMPGAFLMFALMIMAGNQDLGLWAILWWSFVGAVAGDAISFYFGRVFKHRIPGWWPFKNNPKWLEQGEQFFFHHGGKSIFIGRFVGPVRPIIPMVAGMMSMPANRFLMINIISAVGWAICYVLPGYIIGAAMRLNIELPEQFKTIFFATVIITLCCFALIVWIYQNLHPERSIYNYLEHVFRSSDTLEKLWQKLSSPRNDDPSFPLPSFFTLLLSLSLFLGWMFWISHAGSPLNTDLIAFDISKQLHSAEAHKILVVITMLGDPNLLYFCAGWFSIFLVIKRQYPALIMTLLLTASSFILVTLLKDTLAVSRPDILVKAYEGYSLPSGHTVGATVFFGLIATFIAQEMPTKSRWTLYLTALLATLTVASTRVLLGVHWFSDIVAGILLGCCLLALARLCFSPFNQRALEFTRKDIWLPIIVSISYAGYYWYEFQEQFNRYIWLDIL